MIMFARKHIFSFVEFSNSQPTLNFMHRSKDLFGFQADIFPVIPLQSLHSSGKYYELGGRGRGRRWYHQREKCIENRSQLVSNRIAAAAVIPIQNEVANKIFLIFQVTI